MRIVSISAKARVSRRGAETCICGTCCCSLSSLPFGVDLSLFQKGRLRGEPLGVKVVSIDVCERKRLHTPESAAWQRKGNVKRVWNGYKEGKLQSESAIARKWLRTTRGKQTRGRRDPDDNSIVFSPSLALPWTDVGPMLVQHTVPSRMFPSKGGCSLSDTHPHPHSISVFASSDLIVNALY